MHGSDHLHALVRAMSKSEKRYFRIYVVGLSGKDVNQYLELFDALRHLEHYDQDLLLKRLKGKKIATYLPRAKAYLYRLILKAMRAYQAEKSPLRQLRGLIMDGVYLYEKTLYPQSLKTMQKARKLAKQIHDLDSQLEILTWERKLIKLIGGAARSEEVQALMQQEGKLLQSKQAYHAYYDLLDRAFLLTNRSLNARKEERRREVEQLLRHSLLQQVPLDRGFYCVYFYYQTLAFCQHLLGEHAAARTHFRQAVQWWENHPGMVEADVLAYRVLLANQVQEEASLDDYAAIPELVQKMRSLPVRSDADRLLLDQHLFHIEFHLALNLGDLDQAESLAGKISPWLLAHEKSLAPGRVVAFRYNLMVLYFVLGRYQNALQWANALVDAPENKVRQDLRHAALLIQLILYYELGFEEMVLYRFRSVYRYLYRREEIHAFEALALNCLKRVSAYGPGSHPRELLREIHASFLAHQSHPDHPEAPGMEEMMFWLQSRAEGRSIREVAEARLKAS